MNKEKHYIFYFDSLMKEHEFKKIALGESKLLYLDDYSIDIDDLYFLLRNKSQELEGLKNEKTPTQEE